MQEPYVGCDENALLCLAKSAIEPDLLSRVYQRTGSNLKRHLHLRRPNPSARSACAHRAETSLEASPCEGVFKSLKPKYARAMRRG